jgi:hypothetical protein
MRSYELNIAYNGAFSLGHDFARLGKPPGVGPLAPHHRSPSGHGAAASYREKAQRHEPSPSFRPPDGTTCYLFREWAEWPVERPRARSGAASINKVKWLMRRHQTFLYWDCRAAGRRSNTSRPEPSSPTLGPSTRAQDRHRGPVETWAALLRYLDSTRRVSTGRNRDDERRRFCRFLAATATHGYAWHLTCSRRVSISLRQARDAGPLSRLATDSSIKSLSSPARKRSAQRARSHPRYCRAEPE